MEITKNTEEYEEDSLEMLRKEFGRLQGTAYLDHTGATLYAESQVRAIADDLCRNVYGNPHALNPSSKLSAEIIDQIRERILKHFKTDSSKYDVIFTSGATAALHLVAETFDWENSSAGDFVYLSENHTSVLGMREVATKRNAAVTSLSKQDAFNIYEGSERLCLGNSGNALFAYPAQCNFSGYKYPLEWIQATKDGKLDGDRHRHWAVMLDAASFVSTDNLDLTYYSPDFVCLSFYKLFGLPTGIGALLVLQDSGRNFLKKTYFGGGTVLMAMSQERRYEPRTTLHEWFEDGTVSFLSIVALRHGFDLLARVAPRGMIQIQGHTFGLARALHHQLSTLAHANGQRVAILYCDTTFEDHRRQGPVVNFNLLRADGTFVGFSEVMHMCSLFEVHVRTGCFCNPGACQRHLALTNEDLAQHFEAGHVCGDTVDIIAGKPTGSVRASFGYSSTMSDVHKLVDVVRQCFVQSAFTQDVPQTLHSFSARDNGGLRLRRIFLYPVKSCAAQEVQQWSLDSRGLMGDRSWMIVTDANVTLTQKKEPRMCLIKPCLDIQADTLTLSYPDMNDITLRYTVKLNHDQTERSNVCGSRVDTLDCGQEVADWISQALGRSGLRLLRQWPEDRRTQKKGEKAALSLTNQSQFLVIGLRSLVSLEDKIKRRGYDGGDETCQGEELLLRFRANLIISGSTEFEENQWKAITIGSVLLKAEGPCTRCQMVCISQTTGEKSTEPLRTLTAANEGKMQFGAYYSGVSTSAHRLYVGSPVKPIHA